MIYKSYKNSYIYIKGLPGKSLIIVNKNDLHDINVTWQPRRVDWNAHV